MKKSIILSMITAFCLTVATAGFAATAPKKVPAKAPVKAAATETKTAGNPLVGIWGFTKGNVFTNVTFTEDKAVFHYETEGGHIEDFTMSYKFKASPLALDFKNNEGKVLKLSMSYKVKGETLTYRFLNTKGNLIPGLPWEFSQNRTETGSVDGDTVATRDRQTEERLLKEAAQVIVGSYSFDTTDANVNIVITYNTATFTVTLASTQNASEYKTNFSFSKSPLTLHYTDKNGKASDIVLSYKIADNKLTYRFLKGGADIDQRIYKKRINPAKPAMAVADMVADKQEEH